MPSGKSGEPAVTEEELYKELGRLTKNKDEWPEKTAFVSSLLDTETVKLRAKALWLLGEMGLAYPPLIGDRVPLIAAFLESGEPLLRERAINALGRIGRGNYTLIEAYWPELFRFAADSEPSVRLSFIWASENIAVNMPDPYKDHMEVYARLLHDKDDRVRMESPEMFRVLGRRRPELVKPYIGQLREISERDTNKVVRIHCLGAIKAAGMAE